MKTFNLQLPLSNPRPLVVEIPHAGVEIPDVLKNEISVPDDALWKDADIYVNELYAAAPHLGAALLSTPISRYVVDLNRAPDDVDRETVPDHPAPRPNQPRGVVWRMTTDGRTTLQSPLRYADFQQRLALFHTPYHEALRNTLDDTKNRFGHVILLAAHSMPSLGRAGHVDVGARRADIVPGTLGRTSATAAVIDLVDAHFRHAGLTVEHDNPYKGGWTTRNYGQPNLGYHAIQIEINRALYVDEQTFERKAANFANLQGLINDLVEKLAALRL